MNPDHFHVIAAVFVLAVGSCIEQACAFFAEAWSRTRNS